MILDSSKIIGCSAYVKTSENAEEIEVKQIGRVHVAIFHPIHKICIGILIKRPDVAWMFRRRDAFCALPLFEIDDDGDIILEADYKEKSNAFIKSEKINIDACVIWDGMPIIAENEKELGYVESVSIDSLRGEIESISANSGATSKVLLGTRIIPSSLIIGFSEGKGCELVSNNTDDTGEIGCILVKNSALEIETTGGVAKAAAIASVKATNAAKKAATQAKNKANEAVKVAKPKIEQATQDGAKKLGQEVENRKSALKGFKDNLLDEMNK